jgi:transposase-like protein
MGTQKKYYEIMLLTIEITCPRCQSPTIVRNGKKSNGKQNYLCKDCGRQFISGQDITYRGCLSGVVNLVNTMFVRGIGIRDISTILKISIIKVLKVLTSGTYRIKPRETRYDCLEVVHFSVLCIYPGLSAELFVFFVYVQ